VEIISIDNELERNFYYNQSIKESWSIRELKRQKGSGLFMRLALSKNKKQILEMSKVGQNIQKAEDIVKDSYILEFLKIPEKNQSESVLEKAIIDNLQTFLLELGKGFALFGRQYRMTINNTNFYADLVFYHVILKCYVVIDLKIGKVTHKDIGQMNMYLGYFALDKNTKNDNQPIGIILAQEKNDIMVEYATYGIDSKLFVSKYQLYLPNIDELRAVLANKLSLEKH
jgi:predicted nuclease of restriction endonuclease-like (RecB) superfamily